MEIFLTLYFLACPVMISVLAFLFVRSFFRNDNSI